MERFLKRYEDRIIGSITGFDRLLFRGTLRSMCYVDGMRKFLWHHRILYKDFADWAQAISNRLKEHAEQLAKRAGRPFRYVASSKTPKEKIAQTIMEEDGIAEGLVCVLSCVESCETISVHRNRQSKKLELTNQYRKCLFLYFYYADRDFGLMHVRLQTWVPMGIQVWVNGREYLARQMERRGIGYEKHDNCFTRIDDVKRAQELVERLHERKWEKVLNLWARRVNPWLNPRAGLEMQGYYWTMRQTELATDVMFRDAAALQKIYPALIRYAMEEMSSEDCMRYLGRRTNVRFNGEVTTDLRRGPDGVRVKHRVEENSIKMYDKAGSVLRIETTINNPQRFRVHREVTRKGEVIMVWLPMRKGIADLRRRVEVSRAANGRYLEALAVVGETTPSHRILDPVSRRVIHKGVPYRALHPISPQDSQFLAVIARGELQVQGVRNRDLRQHLCSNAEQRDPVARQKAANRITRSLRLLRAHGLIYKVPKTHYYRLTKSGRLVSSTAVKFRHTDIALLAA